MKIIYACSGNGIIETKHNITYNDLYVERENSIKEDTRKINYENYDLIIASPPCNYYSRANYRRNESKYALETKDILQFFINLASYTKKPIIIENVRNPKLMGKELTIPENIFIILNGRHTYFSNKNIQYLKGIKHQKSENIANKPTKKRQGDNQVKKTFEKFIEIEGKEKC